MSEMTTKENLKYLKCWDSSSTVLSLDPGLVLWGDDDADDDDTAACAPLSLNGLVLTAALAMAIVSCMRECRFW